MARNGSGTMAVSVTLVDGNTILASEHNTNNTDFAAEITNSVAVDGQSTLTGQLKSANGTVSAPGITFGSDLNSGFYRIGADNIGLTLGGTKIVDASATGVAVTGTLSASGAFTGSSTLQGTTITATTGFMPDADDGAYLGQSGTGFADLFLASGGVINWNAGNATLTHSAALLTSNVALSVGTSNPVTAGTVELGHATDTTLSRASAGRLAVEGSNVFMASDVATQANQETGSSTSVLVTPGRQHFHPGHPKAGGNFDGSGTPAFRSGDYGMGSITDGGVGIYTLALDTAFADTNYWLTAWSREAAVGSDAGVLSAFAADTKTSSTMQVRAFNPETNALHDATEIGIMFWGDYA